MTGAGGAAGAEDQATLARLRAGYNPARWTWKTWLLAVLAFTPFVVLVVAGLLVH